MPIGTLDDKSNRAKIRTTVAPKYGVVNRQEKLFNVRIDEWYVV